MPEVSDRVGQVALGSLQLEQPAGDDLRALRDAVGAIDGLRLDSRVPPRIEQEDERRRSD